MLPFCFCPILITSCLSRKRYQALRTIYIRVSGEPGNEAITKVQAVNVPKFPKISSGLGTRLLECKMIEGECQNLPLVKLNYLGLSQKYAAAAENFDHLIGSLSLFFLSLSLSARIFPPCLFVLVLTLVLLSANTSHLASLVPISAAPYH